VTWLKIDDGMPRHPKILGLSDGAFRVLITLWCYAAEHETDGHIPDAAWRQARPKQRDELVAAELVRENGTGMVIHGFTERNPTKAQLEDRRAKRSAAGKRGAEARWEHA
jgi:hypothetical protein